jgi:hypothetical protein
MNTTPDASQEEDDASVTIKLRRSTTDDLETIYANHFLITFTGSEFYLVFGEAVPPALIDENDLDSVPEFVDIKPVARLAVSPTTMLKITDAITRTVRNSLQRVQHPGDEDESPR